jgi:hypothetical protein
MKEVVELAITRLGRMQKESLLLYYDDGSTPPELRELICNYSNGQESREKTRIKLLKLEKDVSKNNGSEVAEESKYDKGDIRPWVTIR